MDPPTCQGTLVDTHTVTTMCSPCMGEGKVLGRPTKRARAGKKQLARSRNDTKNVFNETRSLERTTQVCAKCGGCGVRSVHRDKLFKSVIESKSQAPVVAIIGGGIGGLALALALQHRNIRAVVYERDSSFAERKQGYGFTLQQGAAALKQLGVSQMDDKFTSRKGYSLFA